MIQNPQPSFELPHRVAILIPTHCRNHKLIPVTLRDHVQKMVRRKMREWFGANTRTEGHDGEWTHSDGTPMDEDGHTIYSHTTKEALLEYSEDFMVLAKNVADLLAQEEAAIRIDNKMLWFSGDTASVQEEVPKQLKGWVPEAVSARDLSSKEKIHFVLSTLQETSHLLDLFCNQLHYDYANEPLSTRDWPESVKEWLATGSEPLLLAEKNDFKIIYAKLAGDKLLRSQERKVIDRLYQDDPTFRGLVVTSDSKEKQWHLINVKDAGQDANKTARVFRRLRVGPGQSMRTAVDRLIEIDIEKIGEDASAQEIQDAHDKAFDVEAVTKEFYHKISNWYFWALQHDGVVLPRSVKGDAEKSIFFIRMLTRLMFCWFLREKENLVSSKLFEKRSATALLKDSSDEAGTYYKAILQNLFFGTLNQEVEKRGFRKPNGNRGASNLYRYANLLNDPSELKDSLDDIPFVNGGLFDCLDEVFVESEGKSNVRQDDFSEEKKNGLCLPNELFFGQSREVDLSDVYDSTRYENERVQGLLGILDQYQFTIEENTPFDQAVALDPELLGKVFENLLASYNEETKTTARKQLGAFYTPREIVDYMVEESLVAYFSNSLQKADLKGERTEALLRGLFELDEDEPHTFSEEQVEVLISSIDNLKAIDPAVGSGAFPMGLLHKLVLVLGKLDPDNALWKERQRTRAGAATSEAYEIDEQDERERRLSYISQVFEQNSSDYGRKLYLIENCIFGVDIQPIATQIARMRFFISLIADQNTDQNKPNFGVLPLPNLETKFVTANTLIQIQKPTAQVELFELAEVERLQEELKEVRHNLFGAKTPRTKNKYRKLDQVLRERISEELKNNGWGSENSRLLAAWDPYDQNASAPYFDPEWMFGQKNFDIVIGNPPYLRIQGIRQTDPASAEYYKIHYASATGSFDLYVIFMERGLKLLAEDGVLNFINPDKWVNAAFGKGIRSEAVANRNVSKIISLGAHQVFSACTYSSLLWMSKGICPHIKFARLAPEATEMVSLQNELSKLKQSEYAEIPYESLSEEPWILADGNASLVLKEIQSHKRNVGNIFDKIFQGIASSKDSVYFLKEAEDCGRFLDAYSPELATRVQIEKGLVKPLLLGNQVHRYESINTANIVVFPYHVSNDTEERPTLMREREIQENFPKGWEYLKRCERILRSRESGRFDNDDWFQFGRKQGISEGGVPKLLAPDISMGGNFSFDSKGDFYTTTTLYGYIKQTNVKESYEFLLAVMNSKVLWFYLKNSGSVLANGYFRYKPAYLNNFPVPEVTSATDSTLSSLVKILLSLKRDSNSDPTVLIEVESIIEACVMECYFHEHMSERNILFIDELAPHLANFDPDAAETKQAAFVNQFIGQLQKSKIPERLKRIPEASPDLLAVILKEGQV